MTMRQAEETALSVVALTMSGVSPNIFPAAQAGYASMAYLGTHLLVPSSAILLAVLATSLTRGHGVRSRRGSGGAAFGPGSDPLHERRLRVGACRARRDSPGHGGEGRIARSSDAILGAIRPGVTFAALKNVALAAIPEKELAYMQASGFYGHHIGLSSSDPALSDALLEPGMIFTVEPWYYNHDEELAVFIEDVVLVTADGHENLTGLLPRMAEELERLTKGGAP